jgi:uncharacterized protein
VNKPSVPQTSHSPAGGVPSPCISICRTDPDTGWCQGCHRTLQEIAAWSTMSDEQRMEVWMLLPGRRARVHNE